MNNPILEQVARAICATHYGGEIDGANVELNWREFEPDAEAAIQALIDADWESQGEVQMDIDILQDMLKQILEGRE